VDQRLWGKVPETAALVVSKNYLGTGWGRMAHFFPIHHRAPNSPPYCLPSQIIARSSAKPWDPSYHWLSSSSWSWEPFHRPICAMDFSECAPHLFHLGFVYIYEMCIVSEILYGVIPSSGIFSFFLATWK
jgi:hypothetical protein